MAEQIQKLTRAEEDLMQVLWQIEKGLLKEVMAAIPEPKPSQSTVSTLLRILERKGFVDHDAYGKTFVYYPIVQKSDYAKSYLGSFVASYFGGSYRRMLSFFAKEEELSMQDLDSILAEMKGGEKE